MTINCNGYCYYNGSHSLIEQVPTNVHTAFTEMEHIESEEIRWFVIMKYVVINITAFQAFSGGGI